MTSSLVGSEMCIRDSVPSVSTGAAAACQWWQDLARVCAARHVPGNPFICLLYTSDAADDM
eukprot:6634346-Prorocentrum_lima.AAC.1